MVWFVVAHRIRGVFRWNKLAENLVDEQISNTYNKVLNWHMSVNWCYIDSLNPWVFTYEVPTTDILIITQIDPGTENSGVANAQTVMHHCLDPSLASTLQHNYALGHNNLLSGKKWSIFCHDFCQGFEDILEQGLQVVGMMWMMFLRSKSTPAHIFMY